MKKIKSIIILIIISLFLSTPVAISQMMAPEDPSGGPETGDDPIGGGAPVSGGVFIMLGLAAGYGIVKLKGQGKKHIED